MSAEPGQKVIHCRECGRVNTGVGDACAWCGGALVSVTAALSSHRKHPQVLAAAVTFCVGLLLIRVILVLMNPGALPPLGSTWGDPLLWLEALCLGMTALYLVLRQEEGDFRALFLLTVALFAVAEVLAWVAQRFALAPVRDFSTLMAFAVAIYSSLALTAVAYDPSTEALRAQRRPLVAAVIAVLVLAVLRAFGPYLGGTDHAPSRTLREMAGLGVLIVTAGYLIYSQMRRPDRAPPARPAPVALDADRIRGGLSAPHDPPRDPDAPGA
ncbi:MAG: hypothetical protein HS116_05120 [Planctomycetes bacterium]|nr:hypothetical protein [Planctomycetota bacterium]